LISALVVICALGQPVLAADMGVSGSRVTHWREHHIIEVAINPPGSREFVINGAHFAAKSDACRGWEAGDRLALLAGEWHGYCGTAVFRNLSRGRTCEMWCGYAAAFHW
jgi:hypothetical protein